MSDEVKTKWTKFWTAFFEGAWVVLIAIIFAAVLAYSIVRELHIWRSL